LNYRNDLRVNHDTITRLKAPQKNKTTMHREIITLHELAANLDKAINSNVGMHGLRILLYGWMKKTQLVDNKILNDRKQMRGEQYLTAHEALSFSKYAGYDLLN
jgi:hypothetical protein